MKTMLKYYLCLTCLISYPLFAQIKPDWDSDIRKEKRWSPSQRITGGGSFSHAHSLKHAQDDMGPAYTWITKIGEGNQGLVIMDLCSDQSGNFYATGFYSGTVTLASEMFTSTGLQDLIIFKFDGNGSVLWAKSYHTSSDAFLWGNKIRTSPGGKVFVASSFFGSVQVGDSIYSKDYNSILLIGLNSDGSLIWSRTETANESMVPEDMEVDSLHGICLLSSIVTWTSNTAYNEDSCKIALYSLAGSRKWTRFIHSRLTQLTQGKELFYAGGKTNSPESFDSFYISPVIESAIVVGLDSTGSFKMATEIGKRQTVDQGIVNINNLATDANDNIWITGSFTGKVIFGSTEYSGNNFYSNAFVSQIGTDGAFHWAHIGLNASDYTDSWGSDFLEAGDTSIFIYGRYDYDFNFGGSNLNTGYYDGRFLMKMGKSGSLSFLWDYPGFENPVVQNGEIIATGIYDGSRFQKYDLMSMALIWNQKPLSNEGYSDIWYTHDVNQWGETVIQGHAGSFLSLGESTYQQTTSGNGYIGLMNPAGGFIWSRIIDCRFWKDNSYGNLTPSGITFTDNDDIAAWGTSTGDSIVIGDKSIVTNDTLGLCYVTMLDRSGKVKWLKGFSSDGTVTGTGGITTDREGNTTIIGYFSGSLIIKGVQLESAGLHDFFIIQYDSIGNINWYDWSGSTGNIVGRGVVCDHEGNLYVTGSYTGTMNLDSTNLISNGSSDIFIIKGNKAGNMLWAKSFGTVNSDQGRSLAIDDNGNIYFTGVTGPSDAILSFGSVQVPLDTAYTTGYLVKFDKNGIAQWATTAVSSYIWCPYKLDVDEDGNVYTLFQIANDVRLKTNTQDLFYNGFGPSSGVFLKYSGDGVLEWGNHYSASSGTGAFSVAVFDKDLVSIAGRVSNYDKLEFNATNSMRCYGATAGFVALMGGTVTPGALNGEVLDQSLNPVSSASLELIPLGSNKKTVLSSNTDSEGLFSYPEVPKGKFVLKAIPDIQKNPTAIETYYQNSARWLVADTVVMPFGNNPTLYSLKLIELPALSGTGTITGTIVENTGKSKGITKSILQVFGRPMKGASVVLVGKSTKSNENIIARTTTDDMGIFEFQKVPDGIYDVMVDIPNMELLSYHTVEINSSNQNLSDINYIVSNEGILIDLSSGSDLNNFSGILLFPQPAKDYLYVKIKNQDAGKRTLMSLYSMQGRLLSEQVFNNSLSILPLHNLQSGLYIIKIANESTIVSRIVIIQR